MIQYEFKARGHYWSTAARTKAFWSLLAKDRHTPSLRPPRTLLTHLNPVRNALPSGYRKTIAYPDTKPSIKQHKRCVLTNLSTLHGGSVHHQIPIQPEMDSSDYTVSLNFCSSLQLSVCRAFAPKIAASQSFLKTREADV
jgi:hypothetical protein